MSLSKPKILIVDDEQAIIDTIQYVLETEGCETAAALSGNDARAILDAGGIDLVVLDVGLPDISGMDLLKIIRKDSDVPVVFLTARAADIDRILGLELGGDDYVVKPFSPRELAARVKAVLRRSRASGKAASRPSPPEAWHIDEEKRGITFYGERLDLSRYEYNLLLVFLRKPGHVFTRDQLMDQAWEEPEMSMDRTVDAHIKNLRAKLKAVKPEADPILTHRGIGYSLKETP
ncbi:two-component system response regulator CreB [Desulfovibrio sp. OttesenSCG-928-O18]|nr:two-component system response regulator CreB [Desulfovibrio sp. OttesenSCG-928-O18]